MLGHSIDSRIGLSITIDWLRVLINKMLSTECLSTRGYQYTVPLINFLAHAGIPSQVNLSVCYWEWGGPRHWHSHPRVLCPWQKGTWTVVIPVSGTDLAMIRYRDLQDSVNPREQVLYSCNSLNYSAYEPDAVIIRAPLRWFLITAPRRLVPVIGHLERRTDRRSSCQRQIASSEARHENNLQHGSEAQAEWLSEDELKVVTGVGGWQRAFPRLSKQMALCAIQQNHWTDMTFIFLEP